jgi:hypothetical protein
MSFIIGLQVSTERSAPILDALRIDDRTESEEIQDLFRSSNASLSSSCLSWPSIHSSRQQRSCSSKRDSS